MITKPDIMHAGAMGEIAVFNTPSDKASSVQPGTLRILCIGCDEPILADELGGVGKAENGGEAWFHSNIACMLSAADHMTSTHANELKGIARGKHPKPPKEEYRGHSKPIPF